MLKVVKVAVHLLLDILDGDNDDHDHYHDVDVVDW